MAAPPSPPTPTFPQTDLPLSAVRRSTSNSTERVRDVSPSVNVKSFGDIRDDFWGDLNFASAVDLSLKFPTSASVYSDMPADTHSESDSSEASVDCLSINDDESFRLETAVLFPPMGYPAKRTQAPHGNYYKPLLLRNYNSDAPTADDSTKATIPQVPDTTRNRPASCRRVYAQGGESSVRLCIPPYHKSVRNFIQETYHLETKRFQQGFSKSRLLRSRNRLLPELNLDPEPVPSPTTSFLLTDGSDDNATSGLTEGSPAGDAASSQAKSSSRASLYNRLPEKIKRRYLTHEEQLFMLGMTRLPEREAAAIDEAFRDATMSNSLMTGPEERHIDNYHATLLEQVFNNEK
jgi:hypothetical protein